MIPLTKHTVGIPWPSVPGVTNLLCSYLVIGSYSTLADAGTHPTPHTYTRLPTSMVIPSMILEPTAPPARISHNGCPVNAAAVISPVIPPPAASIAVPVPTPVAVAIAAGAPPTGMKCTPPPIRTPPTVIAPINNNGSIIKPPYQF